MIVVCAHCGSDIPDRECKCRAARSNLLIVTMTAAVLAEERKKTIDSPEMRIASAVHRSKVEA